MKKTLFLKIFFTGLVLPISSLFGETLTDALVKTYLNNPTLNASRALVRVEDEGLAEALSSWHPEVKFDYDLGQSNIDKNDGSGSQNRNPRTNKIFIEQNLFKGWRTKGGVIQAREDVLTQRAKLTIVEQSVILAAATAYTDVIRDKAVLKLNQNNERVLKRQLEATKDRFEVGEVTRTDVAQADARLSRAIADKIQAVGDLKSSRARYKNVVGIYPKNLQKALPLSKLPANETESVALARAFNPNVLVAKHNLKSARAKVKIVEGELYPTIDLEGELSRRDQATSKTSKKDQISLTARLSLPLYQGGGTRARIRAAKQSQSQKTMILNAAIQNAIADSSQSWERLSTARAQLRAFNSEVKAAEIALQGVRQEASVGSRTVLDVLDAEQELLDARVRLLRAERDVVVATFLVRQSVGSLTAKKLSLSVKLYNVGKRYNTLTKHWFWEQIKFK